MHTWRFRDDVSVCFTTRKSDLVLSMGTIGTIGPSGRLLMRSTRYQTFWAILTTHKVERKFTKKGRSPLMTYDDTDAHLVARARADDPQAFRLLLERYQALAFYLALRLMREEETARELVQEAFLQAYLSLDHLQEAMRFKSWLYGIVVNVCRNWWRTHPHRFLSLDAEVTGGELPSPLGPFIDLEEVVEEREQQRQIREALAQLTPSIQAVAYLFYYEDRSLQEIACALDLSLAAVKNRLVSARQQLQALVQERFPELIRERSGRRRKQTMRFHRLTFVKLFPKPPHFLDIFTLLWLDERGQRVWAPWVGGCPLPPNQMFGSSKQEAGTKPTTLDFLLDLIHALKGRVEEVRIDTLYEDLLYARIRLRSSQGLHTLKARFDDGLRLAARERCSLVVAETILDARAIDLVEYGETREQQLATVEALLQQTPSPLYSRPKAPANFDFSDELHHWTLHALQENASYTIELHGSPSGQPCLALSLTQGAPASGTILLAHTAFTASAYRGKRLRVRAYIKTDGLPQPVFHLTVSGSFAPEGAFVDEQDANVSYHIGTEGICIKDVKSWTLHEIVRDIPEQARSLDFSFVSCGGRDPGTIWLSGVQLENVEKNVPLTGTWLGPRPRLPLNLDFTQGLEFWQVRGQTPCQYECGTRRHAAYLKSKDASAESSCALQQIIKADAYLGKQVRLSARVKTAGAASRAILFIEPAFFTAESRQEVVQDAQKWEVYDLGLRVPTNAFGLTFGILLQGPGQCWVKDIHLHVVDDQPDEV